jgi:hypothetical protein
MEMNEAFLFSRPEEEDNIGNDTIQKHIIKRGSMAVRGHYRKENMIAYRQRVEIKLSYSEAILSFIKTDILFYYRNTMI